MAKQYTQPISTTHSNCVMELDYKTAIVLKQATKYFHNLQQKQYSAWNNMSWIH